MIKKKNVPRKNTSNNIDLLLNEFCTTVNNAENIFPGIGDTNHAYEMKIFKSHSQLKMMLDNSSEVKRPNLDDLCCRYYRLGRLGGYIRKRNRDKIIPVILHLTV